MAYQQFFDQMRKEKSDLRQKVKSKFNVRLMEMAGEDIETQIRR